MNDSIEKISKKSDAISTKHLVRKILSGNVFTDSKMNNIETYGGLHDPLYLYSKQAMKISVKSRGINNNIFRKE